MMHLVVYITSTQHYYTITLFLDVNDAIYVKLQNANWFSNNISLSGFILVDIIIYRVE